MMNFELLKKSRYISDGDKNTVIIQDKDKDKLNDIGFSLEVITY